MVRGEGLPFDCSVMKVRSKTPEYQAWDNRAPASFLDSCRGYCGQSSSAIRGRNSGRVQETKEAANRAASFTDDARSA
jgi:hypothetical protein